MQDDDKISDSVDPRLAGLNRSGRPKGALNKTTMAAKEAIATAADRLGGVDRLVDWAREDPDNEKAFWTSIYPKLLPLQVNADVNILSAEASAWLGR